MTIHKAQELIIPEVKINEDKRKAAIMYMVLVRTKEKKNKKNRPFFFTSTVNYCDY